MKADADVFNKATAARGWIPLAAAKGNQDDPASMRILQLIDALDEQGKLGPVASRWNDFLAGNVGAGDPYVEALRKWACPTRYLCKLTSAPAAVHTCWSILRT